MWRLAPGLPKRSSFAVIDERSSKSMATSSLIREPYTSYFPLPHFGLRDDPNIQWERCGECMGSITRQGITARSSSARAQISAPPATLVYLTVSEINAITQLL